MNHSPESKQPDDFSLVLGGPLFQFFIRTRLTTDTLNLVKRRVIVISLLTWLPLLVLSVLSGDALGGDSKVLFFMMWMYTSALDFKPEIVAAVVFLLLVVLGPLCVFAPAWRKSNGRACLSMAHWQAVTLTGLTKNGCAAQRRMMNN